ncbi:MAG: efflux RND transporter permease subunit [Rhodobacter sp.]|nr:efflux RND transporter permease subunit [Rhodobacter sp.]
MTGIVDWAGARARMVLAFIALSLLAGGYSYFLLPKEGEPDIEIPAIVISLPFPGISAEDSEKLLVKPIETELADLDGLKKMNSTAVEGYANVVLEFEFGWDKSQVLADVRDGMNKAEAEFPEGAENYTIDEINFSEFPIVIVNLTGAVPERTLLRIAKGLQDRLEGLDAVLEAALAGHRDEMLEVVIDPLRLEAYNVTAGELINVVVNNNQLIAAGEVETAQGAFAVKIPSSFDDQRDVYDLPVKVNGDRVVTLGDLAEIRLTFEDREGTARFNGVNTVALQVVKRKGFNLIDTADLIRAEVERERASWPEDLQRAIQVGTSNDQSFTVASMVSQLEGSVLTAIALVMIVVLGALGTRAALLVGFAIPTSFLLCFAFLALMGVAVSNIVMFGLILAVGMLVDGAIVVVEYADKRIKEGTGPMHAYIAAAKRMFWPVVSSTATTLCAFLPMLFWPGVPGEFMGMLPVTLIFVLSASLVVALIYLPVMGGVAGRMSRRFEWGSQWLERAVPWWIVRAALVPVSAYLVFLGAMQVLNPNYLFAALGGANPLPGAAAALPGIVLFLGGAVFTSITLGAAAIHIKPRKIRAGRRRTPFGWFIKAIAGNPVMPIVAIAAVVGFVGFIMFVWFPARSLGVEFFVESEPEQAIVYVRARGNLSLAEKDALVDEVEQVILATQGVDSAFAFAGAGGLNQNTGGASGPRDTIGQVQIELVRWEDRPRVEQTELIGGVVPFDTSEVDVDFDGDVVLDRLQARLDQIPGIKTEILNLSRGPASGKPVHLRMKGDNWQDLLAAAEIARTRFEATPGLIDIEDTRPLPGIDWQIDVDVEKAGRYGADVATVGGMVQLVTRGILLDTMRVPTSDEEIEIRVRLPEDDRVLSTLDSLKVRTADGLVPLSNFISRKPVAKLGQIDRVDQKRYFDVKADVAPGLSKIVDTETGEVLGIATAGDGTEELIYDSDLTAQAVDARLGDETARLVPINPNERIAVLSDWLQDERPLPAGIDFEWTGDQEEQAESQEFLMTAFAGALGLMFIILLAQFNSFYNAVLVLLAVVLSTTGVLIGMGIMQQPFSIIMTGTGIVALAGIVVNNNIVLIDTYQEYSKYMPRIEAIIRTAEARIRPVLLTTITTMAGLTPMMFGLSLDFIGGGYSVDSPTALWWKQLATAVVFGLGIATFLTLIFTPSMLAARVWVTAYIRAFFRLLAWLGSSRSSKLVQDMALKSAAKKIKAPEIIWEVAATEPDLPRGETETEEEVDSQLDEALVRMLAMRRAAE